MSKKFTLVSLSLFIVSIIMINVIGNKVDSKSRDRINEYFENFDLNLKGIICNVERQKGSLQYLVTLKILNSNFDEFNDKGIYGANFCIVKNEKAIFADNNSYAINDTVYLGFDKNILIKCINHNTGKLEFIKKRTEAIIYNLQPPQKRMKELLESNICPSSAKSNK